MSTDKPVILSRSENARQWEEHVRRYREHKGPLTAYCREAGLSMGAMEYWVKKLSVQNESKNIPRRAFVPVEVMRSENQNQGCMPDPKWLAELIMHLSNGAGR